MLMVDIKVSLIVKILFITYWIIAKLSINTRKEEDSILEINMILIVKNGLNGSK